MNKIARLGSVSFVIALVGCMGRTASFEDERDDPGSETSVGADTGGTSGGDTSFLDDTSFVDDGSVWVDADPSEDVWWPDAPDPDDAPWWEDTGTPIKDSGTPIKDTGVVSSDTGTPIKDTGVVSSDTGIKDTGIKDTGVDAGTLYTTCAKIAVSTCNPSFEMCCKASGFTWDYIGCEDISRNWCDDAVDGVFAGRTSYNAAYADACAAGWKAMTSACTPHLFDWVKNQAACSQLFNGVVPPGGSCTRSTECRAGAGETAYCDETAKRCRAYSVSALGGSCNYFGATIKWCDKGLTCDTAVGKCVTATPVGGSCFGADDTACGIGYSCKFGKCAVGSPAGASCVRDLECASWECSFGKCTNINVPLASKALCGGI
jgi:hypothetical protein